MSDMPPMISLIKRGSDKFPRCIIAKGDAEALAIRNLIGWLLSGLTDETLEAGRFLQQMVTDPDELVRQVVEEEVGCQ